MAAVPIAPVSSVGAGGVDLNALFEQYQQQVIGTGTSAATGVNGTIVNGTDATAATRGSDFASMIGEGLQKVDSLDRTASTKAVQAATGDLTDVHDYVIAAQEAQTAVELTTTLRNKALDAFQEIMRMSL
jgi:flagellar hook-basal body complex protein FliE